jgi:hypothetical protein
MVVPADVSTTDACSVLRTGGNAAPPLELWVWGHWSDFLMAHVLAETMDVWEARAKALSWEEKMV